MNNRSQVLLALNEVTRPGVFIASIDKNDLRTREQVNNDHRRQRKLAERNRKADAFIKSFFFGA